MNVTKAIFLAVAMLAAACGQQQSNSSLRDDQIAPDGTIVLPGKPGAVGVTMESGDGQTRLDLLVKVAPNAPRIMVGYVKFYHGTLNTDNLPALPKRAFMTLTQSKPCGTNPIGWTCRYDDSVGHQVDVSYNSSLDAYTVNDATWDQTVASGSGISAMSSADMNAFLGCGDDGICD